MPTLCFFLISPPGQALPPGAVQTLPKRQIIEKSNGAATTVFNPSMFHYQQALANMQLQQPAFISTGEPLSGDSWTHKSFGVS